MINGQIRKQRSDFIVHWTGKDIHKDYTTIKPEHRKDYLDRLHDILCKGLWMKYVEVRVPMPQLDNKGTSRWAMTCFTEIKLSQVHRHTEHYGCLGFGFSRDFVLKRYGAPVQYVAGAEGDIISQHFSSLFWTLRFFACWLIQTLLSKTT